jgi:hypothetical protein
MSPSPGHLLLGTRMTSLNVRDFQLYTVRGKGLSSDPNMYMCILIYIYLYIRLYLHTYISNKDDFSKCTWFPIIYSQGQWLVLRPYVYLYEYLYSYTCRYKYMYRHTHIYIYVYTYLHINVCQVIIYRDIDIYVCSNVIYVYIFELWYTNINIYLSRYGYQKHLL